MDNDTFQDALLNLNLGGEDDSVAGAELPQAQPSEIPYSDGSEAAIQPENQPTEAPPTVEAPVTEPPVQAPSQAQQSPDMVQLMQTVISLQQQVGGLQQALQQQSQTAEQGIMQQLQQPPEPEQPPVLDYEALGYASDEERRNIMAQYSQAMAEYNRKSVMKEFEPVLNEYKQAAQARSYEAAINDLRANPQVGGQLADVSGDVMNVIRQIPELQQAEPEKAVMLAALISKGRQVLSGQTAGKTPEQLADEVVANPEVMKILEMRRVTAAKQNSGLPPMAASQGAAINAPLNIPPKAKSFDEAFSNLDGYFR